MTVEQVLREAIAHHQAGRLPQAEQLYRNILQSAPAHPDANHNLGVIAVQARQPAAALPFLKLALETNPGQAQFWVSYIEALLQSGQRDMARDLLAQGRQRGLQGAPVDALVARLDGVAMPDDGEVQGVVELYTARQFAEVARKAEDLTRRYPGWGGGWKILGTALEAMNRSAEALAPMERAVTLSPGDAEAHTNFGNTLKALGRMDDAIERYRHAAQLDPEFGLAHYNLATVLSDTGRLPEAEEAYRRALARLPTLAEAHNNLGTVLELLGRPDEAAACYRRAVELDPAYAEAYNNLGALLRDDDDAAEAEALYEKAVELRPDFPQALNNLGVARKCQGRLDDAMACYDRALAADPGYAEPYYNRGWIFKRRGQAAEAEACYRRALQLKPDYPDARGNLAMLLLQQGRYAEGWPEYEARYDPGRKDRQTGPPPTAQGGPPLPPPWHGEPLAGKRMLVWPEQGFGDEIQFARFVPLLRERGAAHITLACKPPLVELFAGAGLADTVLDAGQWNPDMAAGFDVWSYAMSLPLHCGITLDTLPARPYLNADPERVARWDGRLPQGPARIGLVWKGRPTHGNDAARSLPSLAALRRLWDIPGIAFVSLQKGAGEEESAAPSAEQPLLDLGRAMENFADAAAILARLDLLICVDTAMAHLAGALGVPCWVLLPQRDTDWRWLEERDDSPWYPGTMRLFRQGRDDTDWAPAVQRVADALGKWTSERSA